MDQTLVDDRNETTHAYGEKFVKVLYPRIKVYFELMNKIYGTIPRVDPNL